MGGQRAAMKVRQCPLGISDLLAAGFAAQLLDGLDGHVHAVRRLPETEVAAIGIERQATIESDATLANEILALALLAKAQVFQGHHVGEGKWHGCLDDVDVGGLQPGHFVCIVSGRLGPGGGEIGLHGRLHSGQVHAVGQPLVGGGSPEAGDVDRLVLAACIVRPRDHHRETDAAAIP